MDHPASEAPITKKEKAAVPEKVGIDINDPATIIHVNGKKHLSKAERKAIEALINKTLEKHGIK